MADLRLLVLVSKVQNAFFTELAEVLVDEAQALGARAELVTEVRDAESGDVLVVLPPHEYATLEGDDWVRDPGIARRTIGISAEQPHSGHFDTNIDIGAELGAVFDFSAHAAAAYRRAGVEAEHLPFGWTPRWDRFGTGDRARGPEILFLGCASDRRIHALAGLCRHLRTRRSRLVVSDNSAPNTAGSPSFVAGEDKRRLLADTTVLLNIHQDVAPYFEWLRFAEAAHCGVVVLSEPALNLEPFEPDRHLVVRTISGMSAALDDLLDDDDRLAKLRDAAYEELRERPFSASVARLLERAADLDASGGLRGIGPRRTTPFGADREPPWQRPRSDTDIVRQAVREIRLDLVDVRRRLTLLDRRAEGIDCTVHVRHRSPAAVHAISPAAVSVLVALYDHARYVRTALDSVVGGTFTDVELIVVDDGSSDGSGDVVEAWMRANPDVRATLVSSPVNQGLPAARNTALAHAEAERCFVLDADNELVPTGLARLVEALDADPGASFAYGVLQRFDNDGPVGLLGFLPWEPERLRHGNFIDAMAVVRRHALRRVGGFTTDRRLHGWEDYALWCRLAENGERAAHVPTIVGRYRVSATSMLSLTNISVDAAFDALRELAPRLMSGIRRPAPEVAIGGAEL